MTKAKEGQVVRQVALDISEEVYDKLRSRGVLILDGKGVDVEESGIFYRDLFFLVMSGWTKERPIWILLNSPGGGVNQGFAICDAIRAFTQEGYTINIVGLGEVSSVAAAILQTGTRRYALPTTQFLLHQVSDEHVFLKEEMTQTEERAAEKKRINTILCAIIVERVGMDTVEFLAKVKKTDLFMSAQEALTFGKHGLIDEICATFPFMDALEKA